MDGDLPMMMQLCKIKEATRRAETIFEERAAMPKTQNKNRRIPKDVLIEQGISPNPGPLRARKGKSHFGKLVVPITSLMTIADCRILGSLTEGQSGYTGTCVAWTLVGTIERSQTEDKYARACVGWTLVGTMGGLGGTKPVVTIPASAGMH